jgi:hypothetical protein
MSTSPAGAFPLPTLPLPPRTSSRSRRLQQRQHRATAVSRLANLCIDSLNALSVSFAHHRLPTSSNERIRSRLLSRIVRACQRFVGRQAPASCDDTSSSAPTSSTQLKPEYSYAIPVHSAVPIVASKVSLPSAAGTARLLDLLPPHLAQLYNSPQLLLRDTPAKCKVRPRANCVDRSDYVDLVCRLRDRGMLCFKDSVKVVNGVFAVEKDADWLRLIIDARPANCVFTEPDSVQLPGPDLLSQLRVPANTVVYAAKVDLDNFYHRLQLPEWMREYFALPPLSAADVGLPGDHLVYPCCTTLPMGWSHSVFVAQAIHEHLLNTRTRLSPDDRITATSDYRLDRPRHAAYIDDLILVGTDPEALRRLQQEYIAVVIAVGLPPKASKVVPPTCDGVECLGLEIDGVNCTIGLSVPKLQRLIGDTLDLLDRGLCSGFEMAQIVGRWTWCVLPCRPAFAVFSAVYRYVQAANRRVFTIWPSVAQELVTIVGLAPLLFAPLDAAWFDRVIATDASEAGLGVVATKTAANTLLASGCDPTSATWSTIVSSRWRRSPEHINILEARALCTAVRWALSFPNSVCRRLLALSDSQVVVFSVSKGRSSSFSLLRRLRYLASLLLASGLLLVMRWIPSAANPADSASRDV